MEALQAMMGELQKQSVANLAALAKQQFDALQTLIQGTTKAHGGGMTDTRGIGRPIAFRGEETKYAEWKAKLMAYLRVATPKSDDWILWAGKQLSTITEEDVDLQFDSDSGLVKRSAVKFYSILMSCTEDDAFRICHSVKDGNGLEAMRLLMKRYEPRTLGTKRALLKAVINNVAAKVPKEIENNLVHMEELRKKDEVLGSVRPK